MEVLRAEAEWQRAGAYSVRIQGMNRQHHISLREEFDEHDCDGTRYIVMLDEGYPVATCRFYENSKTSVTLGRLVVLPEYRGRELGTKVVNEAEKWIREYGAEKIVINSQDRAQKFYEKQGYNLVPGVNPRDYEQITVDSEKDIPRGYVPEINPLGFSCVLVEKKLEGDIA